MINDFVSRIDRKNVAGTRSEFKYTEPVTFAIARYLTERGYSFTRGDGMQTEIPSNHIIGILDPKEPIYKKTLFGRVKEIRRRGLILGELWVDGELADPDTHWFLEVYGRENVSKLDGLLKDLQKERGVHITARLSSVPIKGESLPGDSAKLL